jgi:hypothetical protein
MPACASTPEALKTEADFIGFITEIQSGQIQVESHADKIVDKYVVTVTDKTMIFEQDAENLRHVPFAALATKQWVRIWFAGPIMESWPKQATAHQVVIEKPEAKPADESIEPEPPEPTEPSIAE